MMSLLKYAKKCLHTKMHAKKFPWGPVGGQKRHARMAFLPPTPLKMFPLHAFINIPFNIVDYKQKITFLMI